MERTLCAVGLAALSLTWSASALADGTTSPGTNSVFVSASFLILPAATVPGGMPTTLLSGQIKKGRTNRVLAIEAMLAKIGTGSPSGVIAIHPTVNGVAVEPSSGGVTFPAKVSCEAIGCFKTGTWWLDIDAAESAHPGMFVNQPLNVVLVGVESSANADFNVAATMTARLQKK